MPVLGRGGGLGGHGLHMEPETKHLPRISRYQLFCKLEITAKLKVCKIVARITQRTLIIACILTHLLFMFHFVGFFILSLHAYVHVCIFEVFECIFLSPEYLRTRSFFIVAFVQVIKFRNIDYNTIVCSTDYIKISPNIKCLSSLYSQSNIQPIITDSICIFCLFNLQ